MRAGLLAAALIALACASSVDVPVAVDAASAEPGRVRSIEPIRSYPAFAVRLMAWWAELPETLTIEHGIELYRVEYWTTGPGGELTWASGLIAFPKNAPLRGVVSYQHGTRSLRSEVPSTGSLGEGLFAAAVFAGHGYLLLAPDYVGLGSSPDPHPYLHAETAASAVIDLLKAGREIALARGLDWPDALFLSGFSQGGHASMAAMRALEAAPVDGLRVTAAAPMAGPYDLSGISFPFALQGLARSHSLYLGYMVTGYARVYGESLDSVVRPPYASQLPVLFDGTHGGDEITAALPPTPRLMFSEEFLEAFDDGRETWLAHALADNDVYDWKPAAPVRLFYGSLDVDVPPEDAKAAAAHMAALGADVEAVDVGNRDHEDSVLSAAPQLRAWFDRLAGR